MESQRLLIVLLVLTALIGCGQSQKFGSLPSLPDTGVRLFLGEEDIVIANFSMIAAGSFHDTDIDGPGNITDFDGQNDGLWCQSSLNQNMIGTWYYPDGTTVPPASTDGSDDPSPLYANNTATGQIGLLRNGGIASVQGLYSCVIPNEEGINQTLYVAAYGNADFIKNDELPVIDSSGPSFQLLSSVDADSPVFSLSFTVTNRSPTIVTCSVDNRNQFNVSDNDLIRTVTPVNNDVQVQVSVIFRMRVSGLYACSVTTDRIVNTSLVSTNMAMRNVTVTGSPSDLTYNRDNLRSVTLDWSPSALINDTSQYLVFVNNSNGIIMNDSTTNTELSLPLHPDDEYNIRLVAIDEDLPSEVITVTVPQVVSIEVQGPVMMPLDHSSSFSLTCTLTLAPEVNDTTVEMHWASPDLIPFDSTTDGGIVLDTLEPTMISVNDSVVYTLTLNFNSLQASQVGEYVCGALLNADTDANVTIRSNYSVSVQVPTPVVTSSLNTTGRIFESNDIQLLCIVTVTPLDVEPNVTINWFGPNGLITMNDTEYSISTGSTINGSVLTFTASLSDNGTDYYCTASFGPASNVNRSELIIPSDTAISNNTTITVEIVPLPMVSVMDIGIPVTGDSFQLVCTGTAPANVSSIATVSVQWLLNGTVFTNDTLEGVTVTNSGSMATLSFSSLNASTHERDDYNCVATLSIPDVPTTKTASTTNNLLTLTNPIVSIFANLPVFAGEMYSLNCTVTIVAGVLNITWFNSSGNDITEGNGISFNSMTISNTVQRYDLIFNSLDYSNIGVYTCQASLTVDRGGGDLFNGTGSANTTVSIRIPEPKVSISPGDDSPFIRGTVRTVNCSVVFTPPLPTNRNVSFTVFKDGAQVSFENSSRLIAVQTGTTGALTFQPLNFSDAGNYTCTATARDNANNPLIIPSSASDEYIATVQAIPVPNITFSTTTGRSLGESLILNCTVDVLDDLYNINVISSIVRNGELINSTTGSGDTTAIIMIDSLKSSDAGEYQCIVNITQSDIDYEFNGMESTEVILTIPTPSVIVEYNVTGHLVDGELAEGQFLDIMCIADFGEYVDTSVSVTMIWRRNNTELTNGSDFTISPPVMTNNQYTGVLRINSLRDELDNGASYNCSVSATPGSSLIAGNNNSNSVTLTVARFDINHVDISINIPSVPVAGDVFNLSCVIVVPPNFVENLTSVRWTYDLEASQDVTSENYDATLVPVVRNRNIFTSVLTLDPVKTTDARQYYCQATILVFGTVDRTNRDLTVQIPPPSVSIVADPPSGPIYESTGYFLTCTATVNATIVDTPVTASVVWTDPSGNPIPTNEARRQVIPPTGNSLVSMLLFLPIDTGFNNDGGTYICQMIINSGNSLIASSQPTSTTLDVTVESLPPMTVDFSSVGSVEVGQSLTITCTITTVERLVVTPMVTFIKMNDTDMEMLSNLNRPYSITTDDTGSVTNYTLILDPLRFEDAGMYTCMAEFNVTGFNNTNDPSTATNDYQEASDTFRLIVDFPPVIVTISKERDDTLYAGTSFFINCDIMLDPLVTIPVTVTNQWTRDGTNVPMGSSDATITEDLIMINTLYHNATLMFYPLDNADDSGMYTCNVEVTAPNSYMYLRNTSASANTSITVMATPMPIVQIVTMGMAEPGEEYILNCTVTVVNRLIVSPVITWTKRSANNVISVPPDFMIVSNVMSSLYLRFSSLNTSDAGLYTCEAFINVSQISMVARNNDTSNLPLEIPIPSVDLSQSRENYFLAGSNLILTCDISVDPNVDTPFIVDVTWNMTDQQIMSSGDFGDESSPNSMRLADTDRVNISSVMMRSGFNEYRSTVNFTTLSSIEDSGTYTCIVTIVPAPIYQYVMTSDTNYMNVNFTVTDPMIRNFSASPNSFLGLETSCSDSYRYDNFTLTCTATKPTIVIPNLVIAWTLNGTIETGTVTTTREDTMTTTVTNVLNFTTSTASDSGTYRCTASITIPNSPDITTSEESTVTIRPQSLPVAATNVVATPGDDTLNATTAAISFTIPNIAYTPETYSVKYTGMILQTTEQTSMIRMSSDDITAIDQEFTIMLTGLEEDNTYTYTVDSTNCLGTTSTAEMSFRTIPILPVASPLNCANITFLPRNVTLTWTAPALIDQNGVPVGYNLVCMNTDGVSVNGLHETRSTPNTSFTITNVTPFTSYTCELSFINVVGEGPSTQCTFETAQDTPDNGPQNFTSTPTMTTVTFRWSRPSIPNGIITGYQLKVTNIETSAFRTMTLPSDQLMFTLNETGFFSAYDNYTATVAASTIIGFGPISNTAGRTLPDISSPPLLVTRDITISGTIFTTLPSVDNHTINVTWSPPTTPNGRIMNYVIEVDGYITRNRLIRRTITDVDRDSFTVLITDNALTPGVPYSVTLVAYNEFGRGMPVRVIVFTRVLTPSVSPSNVQAVRSDDGTNMTITWDAVSLTQARGFFEYTIRLTRSSKKRQGEDTIRVPFTETSYTATGLDDQATYSVSMGLSVDDGSGQGPIAGPTSPPIEISSPASTAPPTTSSNINTIIGIVVGVVLALLLIVLIVVIIIFIVRKGRRADKFKVGSKSKRKDFFELVEANPLTPTGTTTFRQLDDGLDSNGASAPVVTGADGQEDDDVKEKPDDRLDEEMILERMKPIAVASFHEHVQEMHVDSDKGFETEYKSVPMQTETSFDIGRNEGNKTKNRFANIFPYDFSRVKLTELTGVPDSDYINACYIDGYNRKDCYIAAQGPLPSTVADFWRTIWEYRINHIVMLTGVVEGGKKKCEQYWPEKVGENLELPNGFTVTMTSFVQFADYIIRDFKASKAESDEKDLTVSHYHFTSWPDHGVPQFATSLISFIKRVQKDHNKDKGVPLMVHCSAGVGRTGTFIMLDIMMDRLKQEESINVYEVLRQLRSKRMYMVQTQAQYVFLHDALDELTTCGDTSIIGSNLRARVNKMHKMIPGKNITGFQEQYELLDQVGYKPSEMMYSDGTTTVNVPKNRYPEIVPLNMHRPRLRPDGSNGSDYINASFVDGYKQRNAYIVTQGPLKNTVDDFWRMIMEFKTRTIVQFCNTVEEGQEKCHMYWPTKEGEPVEYGRTKVTLQSEATTPDYTTRKLHICNERGGKSEREGHVVTQFHFTTWPEHGHPTSTGSIIELIDLLTRAQMNSGNKAITVVCNDGVGRSGAFLCIHSQLERLKTEGEVDVFKYLKTARTRRIGLLSELDHYVFCHEVLADYVESFDPYANFKDM